MSTHDAYFSRLQAALQAEGELLPRLIVDLDRLDHNIDQAPRQHVPRQPPAPPCPLVGLGSAFPWRRAVDLFALHTFCY